MAVSIFVGAFFFYNRSHELGLNGNNESFFGELVCEFADGARCGITRLSRSGQIIDGQISAFRNSNGTWERPQALGICIFKEYYPFLILLLPFI